MRALYRQFLPAERFILDITLSAAVIDAVSLVLRGIGIDAAAYLGVAIFASVLTGMGLAYRRTGRSERIAAALICTGLFIAFSLALATFNYLLMPVRRPLIDPWLARIDAVFGYHWANVIALAAHHPAFSKVLALAYESALAQVALMIALLGLTGRVRELHTMCLTLCIGACTAIMFWGLFPSIGPTWLSPQPAGTDLATVRPLLGLQWGEEFHRLVMHGVSRIAPRDIQGVIAFPSFHTVLACILIYFSRYVRVIFPFMALVNLLVLPALLIHGSHHLVDVPGGFATFLLALAAAKRVMAGRKSTSVQSAALPEADLQRP